MKRNGAARISIKIHIYGGECTLFTLYPYFVLCCAPDTDESAPADTLVEAAEDIIDAYTGDGITPEHIINLARVLGIKKRKEK